MKYYLIAGEASGDLHGANLMKALKQVDPLPHFRYFGGELMQAQGGQLDKHYSEMAFMGFVEVLANLGKIFKNLKQAKQAILAYQPDVLILIDFPGFNLKIASFAKKKGIKVFYYISPKVWAWNQKRVLSIKENIDQMFCILPFEVAFYKKWGMDVHYIGNPLLDAISGHHAVTDFRNRHALDDKPIIALLPGSRRQELERILPAMIDALEGLSNYHFVIAGAPTFDINDYQLFVADRKISVVFDQTYNLLQHAYAAVVTSGTATLETALFGVPQVVVYKGSPLSVAIGRLVIKIKFISLVNLIMNRLVVKELIQEDCNAKTIRTELDSLLNDNGYRQQMLNDYQELSKLMGSAGASEKAAKIMYQNLLLG